MCLFRVLPVLSLLLGAHASPPVLDLGKSPRHRVEARQIGTNVCFPIKVTSTITELLPFGFAYVTHGGGASGSTFFTFEGVPEKVTACACLSTIPSAIAVEIAQYLYQFAPEPTNEFENAFVNAVCD